MKKRIIGIDVARALAVIGMIIVNFKMVFGSEGNDLLKSISGLLDGKAAATFVVLAGVGIALMSNTAVKNQDAQKLKTTRLRIFKRAIFLFIAGLSYIIIWPADILHFYGIYMLIVLMLLRSSQTVLIFVAAAIYFIYPLLMMFFNYDLGWNFDTFEYADFWTINGFFRNLFFNGFHPVIPWAGFMVLGLWFGRMDLRDRQLVKKVFWISLGIFIFTQISSQFLVSFISGENLELAEELKIIFGTSPMPPLPIYMISGSAIAITVISGCILIAEKIENNAIITALNKTGQMALTFYVAHVIFGMGLVEVFCPNSFGKFTIEFSVTYGVFFSLICVGFAIIWSKFRKSGPLEYLMRKFTD